MSGTKLAGRKDRIHRITRWVSVVVLPFLLAAALLLYLLPRNTGQHFAWTIEPPLTALFLGSAYVGGIWFFGRVLAVGHWHRVKYGFPAVLLFATMLAIATFLHWDRFHFGHISFLTWVTLYVSTPVLIGAILIRNWREDPCADDEAEVRIPFGARAVLGLLGAAILGAGLALFLFPSVFGQIWAWDLTPLTGRIVGAVLTLPGMVNVWLFFDQRWSAFRWVFQAQLVSLAFILGALLLGGGDLEWSRIATRLFVGGILVSGFVYVLFYLWSERSLKAAEARLRHDRGAASEA